MSQDPPHVFRLPQGLPGSPGSACSLGLTSPLSQEPASPPAQNLGWHPNSFLPPTGLQLPVSSEGPLNSAPSPHFLQLATTACTRSPTTHELRRTSELGPQPPLPPTGHHSMHQGLQPPMSSEGPLNSAPSPHFLQLATTACTRSPTTRELRRTSELGPQPPLPGTSHHSMHLVSCPRDCQGTCANCSRPHHPGTLSLPPAPSRSGCLCPTPVTDTGLVRERSLLAPGKAAFRDIHLGVGLELQSDTQGGKAAGGPDRLPSPHGERRRNAGTRALV
nr:uncharacterized protein LOC109729203 [Microcebus murinus]